MEALLRMKAWQVFLLTGASSLVSVIVRITYVLHLGLIPFSDVLMRALEWTDLASTLFMLAWSYIAGVKLQERAQSSDRSILTFKYCLGGIVATIVASWVMPATSEYSYTMSVVILFATLGFYIYTDYFVAKLLVLAERENGSVGGTLFALLFFPIGIWWVQPRINKVFYTEWEDVNPDTPLDHNLDQQPQS